MPSNLGSSRNRFTQYKQLARERAHEDGAGKKQQAIAPPGSARRARSRSLARQRSFGTLLKSFWHHLDDQRPRLIGALALLTTSTLLALGPLSAPLPLLDYVFGEKDLPAWILNIAPQLADRWTLLNALGVALIVVAVVSTLIGVSGRWLSTMVAKRLQVSMRRRAFDKAVRLPLHRVYAIKSGGVASILREDAGGVGELVFSMIYNPWRAIVQLTASLTVLVLIEWRLLLGAVVILPVVWYTHRTWITRIRPMWRDTRMTRQGIDAHAAETFGGVRVVRGFGRQRSEATTFTKDNHFLARQELRIWWWSRGIETSWALLIPMASALLIWVGGVFVLRGELSLGALFTFMFFLTALLGPIATLANSATGFQNNLAGLDRTLDLLEEREEFADNPAAVKLNKFDVRGDIEVQNISFAYPADDAGNLGPNVLHDVSLTVKAGEMVAFVGPSGAGKTTLCNLIARFYDPTAGRITLDGRDLKDIDIENYRDLLGIVEQDTFLFDGSVAANIAYANRDATRADIERAAKQANAHGFITDFENGYDTLIGERGVKLSGGQRQRITIARAILADPKILILDEATSNLDTESERLIQGSLARLMRDRTSFVIAHRLSTIQHADKIAVVDHGTIVEVGTHDELMNNSGRYRDMVDLQTRPPETEEDVEAEEAAEAERLGVSD
ncbi:MAG: ABC transporter ATP-binding protein [Phycisphaerae bacterium]